MYTVTKYIAFVNNAYIFIEILLSSSVIILMMVFVCVKYFIFGENVEISDIFATVAVTPIPVTTIENKHKPV